MTYAVLIDIETQVSKTTNQNSRRVLKIHNRTPSISYIYLNQILNPLPWIGVAIDEKVYLCRTLCHLEPSTQKLGFIVQLKSSKSPEDTDMLVRIGQKIIFDNQ